MAVGANRAVFVLFLHRNGTVRANHKISETTENFQGPLSSQFGHSLATLGDLDGDGVMVCVCLPPG
jgi:hypothetical protein